MEVLGKMRLFGQKNVTYSPTNRPYLHAESHPTRLGWFMLLIVVFQTLRLSPKLHNCSPTPFLHFPHRYYPFSCYGRRDFFSLCPFQNNYRNILANVNTFQKTYYILTSNYYKMHCAKRINDTVLLKTFWPPFYIHPNFFPPNIWVPVTYRHLLTCANTRILRPSTGLLSGLQHYIPLLKFCLAGGPCRTKETSLARAVSVSLNRFLTRSLCSSGKCGRWSIVVSSSQKNTADTWARTFLQNQGLAAIWFVAARGRPRLLTSLLVRSGQGAAQTADITTGS
jgi:hypothetical protein